ncbi:MAG: DUF465 domain-containing protein [Pseudomonadota bacterium]
MSADDKSSQPSLQVIEGGASETEAVPEPAGANDAAVKLKISELEEEHRDLDQAISTMEERMPYDRLTIGRLKKRKLLLKDQIQELRDQIHPDIIA